MPPSNLCKWGEGGRGGIASGERKGTYSSGRMEDAWKTREPVLLPSCELTLKVSVVVV